MAAFNWTCPFCNRPQTVIDDNRDVHSGGYKTGDPLTKSFAFRTTAIRCQNPDCNKTTVGFSLHEAAAGQYGAWIPKELIREWKLVPESSARVFPDYIPAPLREDYEEACRIAHLSPKSSATLARRCLQGAIRDFCKIAKPTLKQEIDELRRQVDDGHAPRGVEPETVDAIDHVRGVGNIGAHMEKDINLIIEVDSEEASVLIGLIEMLFEEWYIARHKRQERLKKVEQISL